ncbi:MAG TPA: HD-GYP domain-containing protein [Holophagaceae bacterium]
MSIKRVRVEQLQPGMFVHDLNCGWLDHSFLRSRFLLDHPRQIEKIRAEGIHEVYIDTARGDDVPEAPTLADIQQDLAQQLQASAESGPILDLAPVAHREEAAAARRILGEATEVVSGLLHDVRLGRQLEPAKARPVIRAMRDSVLRNPGALLSLGRIKAADAYTFQHSVSIGALMVSFCHALGMDPDTVEEAGLGGLLHDVGKMRVPGRILNKPGKLTEDELAVMKGHAALSEEILSEIPGISRMVMQIAGEHHEKVAGGGYPRGTAGEGISVIGRMTAIVDVYDALTSQRVYHRASEPTEVMKRLLEWSGTHLDHDLVQRFIRTLGIYPVGSLVRLASGRLAVVVDQGENLLRPTVRIIYDAVDRVPLAPRDLDLTRAATEEIVDFEEPETWGLQPSSYF